jgi:hypothetical protein
VYHLNRRRLRSWRQAQIRLAVELIQRLTRSGSHTLPEALDLVTEMVGDATMPWAGAVRAIARDPAVFGLVGP